MKSTQKSELVNGSKFEVPYEGFVVPYEGFVQFWQLTISWIFVINFVTHLRIKVFRLKYSGRSQLSERIILIGVERIKLMADIKA